MNISGTGDRVEQNHQPHPLRTLLKLFPLLFVAGLSLFWLLLTLAAPFLDIRIHVGDPKDVLPGTVMWIGYMFLAGTLLNVAIYPICLLLSALHSPVVQNIRLFSWIFVFSVAALYLLWPSINWFLD